MLRVRKRRTTAGQPRGEAVTAAMMWSVAAVAVVMLSVVSFGPTPRIWQRRVIRFRAAVMTAAEMWRAAWERGRAIWPEMERRARTDV